jgi:hypothetical protein
MSMLAYAAPAVTPEVEGAALHAALLAEATVLLSAAISTPEEAAAVVDEATGGRLDEVALSIVADAIAE